MTKQTAKEMIRLIRDTEVLNIRAHLSVGKPSELLRRSAEICAAAACRLGQSLADEEIRRIAATAKATTPTRHTAE